MRAMAIISDEKEFICTLIYLVSYPPSCYTTLDFSDSWLLHLFTAGFGKFIQQVDEPVFGLGQVQLVGDACAHGAIASEPGGS